MGTLPSPAWWLLGMLDYKPPSSQPALKNPVLVGHSINLSLNNLGWRKMVLKV